MALTELIKKELPEILLLGATTIGRSLGPRVAARVGTGLTADCTGLAIDSEKGLLLQTRPAFGGNIMATIVCPSHRPQMATVRPKVFQSATGDPSREGEIISVDVEGWDGEAKDYSAATFTFSPRPKPLPEGTFDEPLDDTVVHENDGDDSDGADTIVPDTLPEEPVSSSNDDGNNPPPAGAGAPSGQ